MPENAEVVLRRVRVPTTTDDADLRASVDIANAVTAHSIGTTELASSYTEALGQWQPNPYERAVRLLADVDGVPVGRGYVGMRLREDQETAYVNVWVLPGHRRRGVGRALLHELEDLAGRAGRSRLRAWALAPAAREPLLTAATGAGVVGRDTPGTRFAVGAGFVLQQVERMSRLDLTTVGDRVDTVLAEAQRSARPDYRTVEWVGFTPEPWLEDMAWLCSRMSTDAPHGDMVVDEEVWDAERVRSTEAKLASDDRYLVTAAAEHVATGRLVAYTTLTVPRAARRVARQEDTLVTAAHRGHRLGTLLKAANIRTVARLAPEVPAVYTWNAEENRPMLDVNERLGFVAVGAEGQWERGGGSPGPGSSDDLG